MTYTSVSVWVVKPSKLQEKIVAQTLSLFKNGVISEGISVPKKIKFRAGLQIIAHKEIDVTEKAVMEEYLQVFYKPFKKKRQFPYFRKVYRGLNILFFIGSFIEQEGLDLLLKGIKGQPAEYTDSGKLMKRPRGFRGLYMPSLPFYSKEQYKNMSDSKYDEIVPKIVDNLIHTTDNLEEVKAAVRTYLDTQERRKILKQISIDFL